MQQNHCSDSAKKNSPGLIFAQPPPLATFHPSGF